MYFDIKHIESVDEFGNKCVELKAVLTAPVYDDITPRDMSLENQQKAGVNMQRVSSRSSGNLETADKAESAMIANGESIFFSDPTSSSEHAPSSDPTSSSEHAPSSEHASSSEPKSE